MTTKKEKISGGVPKNPVMKYLYLNKGILAGALGIFLVFGFLTEFKFWGRANVINILRITSLDSIAAFGVTLIIITGGIDLSVGALMACASTYCALQWFASSRCTSGRCSDRNCVWCNKRWNRCKYKNSTIHCNSWNHEHWTRNCLHLFCRYTDSYFR